MNQELFSCSNRCELVLRSRLDMSLEKCTIVHTAGGVEPAKKG